MARRRRGQWVLRFLVGAVLLTAPTAVIILGVSQDPRALLTVASGIATVLLVLITLLLIGFKYSASRWAPAYHVASMALVSVRAFAMLRGHEIPIEWTAVVWGNFSLSCGVRLISMVRNIRRTLPE